MEEDLNKKIEEILERKLESILEKQEELKKRKEEEETQRMKYVQQIWRYFPGAKTKHLSYKEAKEIAESLEELAKKVEYTPILPKQARIKFFINKKRLYIYITLGIVIVAAAVIKFLG